MRPFSTTSPRHRRRRAVPRAGALLVVGAILGSVLAVVGVSGADPDPDTGSPARPVTADPVSAPQPGAVEDPTLRAIPPARGAVVRAADVLRAWDAARARAWAEGDVTALRDLYVDRAGVADVRLLRRYADRGYRVRGLTTQLLAVTVLDHAPGRWRLRVTDRLTSAVAVRDGVRLRLPRDEADTHLVVLVRDDGRWRVARTRPA